MPVIGPERRRTLVLGVVLAAVFMANLDLWIVNVALVAMGRSFGGSLSGLSWVLDGYAVMLAALLIPAGRLGDRIGHRKVFLAGIALFTLASLGCAVAPDLAVLIVARLVQAAGAAAQLPTSLALLLAATDATRRMQSARTWSAAGAVAAVAGPVLGGLLVTLSWRWVFVVNLPVGVVVWLLGRRFLPHPPARDHEPMPDVLGSVLLVVALGALTGALVEAPTWGWTSARAIGLLAVAAVGTLAFVRRCHVNPAPMIELRLLRIRRFATANLATFLFGASFAIMLLSNALWCQDAWHYSALRTGFAMAPGPLMVPFVTIASARLVHRIGPGPVAAVGGVVFTLSQLWRVFFTATTPDYARDLLPSMILGGVGVGLALSTLVAVAATALPHHRSATGSAIVNSIRQVSSALGVAVLVTLLAGSGGLRHDYRLGWTVAAGLALLSALAALLVTNGGRAAATGAGAAGEAVAAGDRARA